MDSACGADSVRDAANACAEDSWARNVTDNDKPLLLRADDVPLDAIGELGQVPALPAGVGTQVQAGAGEPVMDVTGRPVVHMGGHEA